jgi:hypothetical protein
VYDVCVSAMGDDAVSGVAGQAPAQVLWLRGCVLKIQGEPHGRLGFSFSGKGKGKEERWRANSRTRTPLVQTG